MYIQYKIFETVSELNKWLKEFRYKKVDDRPVLFCNNADGQHLELMEVSWLPGGSVSGNDEQINGSIGHYAVVKYGVWSDAYNQ